MPRKSLLDEIQTSALDPDADLPTMLRKCIALGGATNSESLRHWAALELKGYAGDAELPSYRKAAAPLLIDGVAGFNQIKGQQLPVTAIPEVAQGKINNDIEFRQPIAELIQWAVKGEQVRLAPQGSGELVALLNYQIAQNEKEQWPGAQESTRVVERLYWSVSSTTILAVADVVRTTLIQLVAEMRAEMPPGTEVPSTEAADRAVYIAIEGGKKNQFVFAQNGGTAEASSDSSTASTPEPDGRRIGWWVFGAATVIAAVAAVATVFL